MIKNVKMYAVLNSTGTYALHVKLWTRNGCYQATVPVPGNDIGAVKKMREVFSPIRGNFVGLNEEDWMSFDSFLAQMNIKKSIHPSLSLALSIACARAATQNELWEISGTKKWFPYVMGTVILGKDWKEFMVIPHKEKTVMEAFESLLEVWNIIGGELKEGGLLRGRSIRGAWMCDLGDLETLYFLSQIAKDWNMRLGVNIGGSAMWNGKVYKYASSKGTVIRQNPTSEQQMSLLSAITEQYKLWYLEDPFHGADFMSHAYMSQKLEDTVIAGGDLYDGDIARMKRGVKIKATKAIALSPRHLSSVSQLSSVSEFAHGKGLKIVLSRADRETEDNWMSDLAVAFRAEMIKIGVMGGDNISKYNRLLQMWDDAPGPRMGTIGSQ